MDTLASVLLGLIIVVFLLWLLGYLSIKWVSDSSYIGGGPNYRNWTSGATQRFGTEFSGTNQGAPGNMAATVRNPSYYEAASRTNGSPQLNRDLVSNVWQKDMDEQALHNSLLTGENVNLKDVVNNEGGLLNSQLY